MVNSNHSLATQENYDKEEDYDVRMGMVKINDKLTTKN